VLTAIRNRSLFFDPLFGKHATLKDNPLPGVSLSIVPATSQRARFSEPSHHLNGLIADRQE
jgi:hypothetical protein